MEGILLAAAAVAVKMAETVAEEMALAATVVLAVDATVEGLLEVAVAWKVEEEMVAAVSLCCTHQFAF